MRSLAKKAHGVPNVVSELVRHCQAVRYQTVILLDIGHSVALRRVVRFRVRVCNVLDGFIGDGGEDGLQRGCNVIARVDTVCLPNIGLVLLVADNDAAREVETIGTVLGLV